MFATATPNTQDGDIDAIFHAGDAPNRNIRKARSFSFGKRLQKSLPSLTKSQRSNTPTTDSAALSAHNSVHQMRTIAPRLPLADIDRILSIGQNKSDEDVRRRRSQSDPNLRKHKSTTLIPTGSRQDIDSLIKVSQQQRRKERFRSASSLEKTPVKSSNSGTLRRRMGSPLKPGVAAHRQRRAQSLIHIEYAVPKPTSTSDYTEVDIDAVIKGLPTRQHHRRSAPHIPVKLVQDLRHIVHAAAAIHADNGKATSMDIDNILAINTVIPSEMTSIGFSVQSVEAIGQKKSLLPDVDILMGLATKDVDEVQVLLRSPEFEVNPAETFLHQQEMLKLHDNDIEQTIRHGENMVIPEKLLMTSLSKELDVKKEMKPVTSSVVDIDNLLSDFYLDEADVHRCSEQNRI